MTEKEVTLHFDEEFIGYVFIFFCMCLFTFYAFLATKTAFLGEDEISYFRMSKEMHEGKFTGFTFDGQPITAPLMLSFISSILFNVLGEQLAVLKVVSSMFGLFSVILLYFAVKKLKGIMPAILTSSLMMSMIIFSHFLVVAYVEDMIVFFSSLVIFILTMERNTKYALLLGLSITLAFFAKQSGLMLFPVVFIYLLWTKENKKYILISLMIPLAIWGVFILHNISVYRIPAVFILNDIWYKLYGNPYPETSLPEFKAVGKLFFTDVFPSVGYVPMLFILIGFYYVYLNPEEKFTKISIIAVIIFMILSASMLFLHEARYMTIIFPFMVLMTAGYWEGVKKLFADKNKVWIFYLIAGALVVWFIHDSLITVQATSTTQRWNPSYINGLQWIRNNTKTDATIFTAYGGSVYYYADRNYTWVTPKFPEIMRSTNSTIVYNDLVNQGVDYIYIWQGIVGNDYIIPQSNLFGIFTVNFMNLVRNDTSHFTEVFQNDIGVIYKVEKNESQSNISQPK